MIDNVIAGCCQQPEFGSLWDNHANKFNDLAEQLEGHGIDVELLNDVVNSKLEVIDFCLNSLYGTRKKAKERTVVDVIGESRQAKKRIVVTENSDPNNKYFKDFLVFDDMVLIKQAGLVMYINNLIESGEIWEKRPVDKLMDERPIFIMPGLPVDYFELESLVIVEPEYLKKLLEE